MDSRFEFKKRYGQNFIYDKNLLSSIVAKSGVEKGDTVVEIGAGAGTLTAALAERAKRVIAYEIDGELESTLAVALKSYDNVELHFADFMTEQDISSIVGGDEYKVVANLPYYITTPILFKLIEQTAVTPLSISVMVQREVADRLCAAPGGKDYGALTVAIDVRYEAKKIISVPRTMFRPAPNVDSAVVLMTKRADAPDVDLTEFSSVVRAAFAMRRKTLLNNLTAAFFLEKSACESLLERSGFSPQVRGEALSTADFVRLTTALSSVKRG